jgi:hypothetical protein
MTTNRTVGLSGESQEDWRKEADIKQVHKPASFRKNCRKCWKTRPEDVIHNKSHSCKESNCFLSKSACARFVVQMHFFGLRTSLVTAYSPRKKEQEARTFTDPSGTKLSLSVVEDDDEEVSAFESSNPSAICSAPLPHVVTWDKINVKEEIIIILY